MDNCQTCQIPGTLQVTDTQQIASGGAYLPLRNRAGCAAHPPIAIQIAFGGTITLVAPTGYSISSTGTLVQS